MCPHVVNNAFSGSLHCRLRASSHMHVFIRCAHALAAAIVLLLALYRPWLLLAVPVLALSYYRCRRRTDLSARAAVHQLLWVADNRWIWWRNDGQEVHGHLVGASVLGDYLVILRLRGDHGRLRAISVCLPDDSLDAQTHRRLRAGLTLWRPERGADSSGFAGAFRQRARGVWSRLRGLAS